MWEKVLDFCYRVWKMTDWWLVAIILDSGHPKEENKMAEGLITDCRLLLSRFENLKTVRFEKFCEVWREMNFSLIHW